MKRLFLVVFLFSVVFSQSYGPSVLILEKDWIISTAPGSEITLDGIFIVNNSWQKVTEIEVSPGVELEYLDNGIIKVKYDGVSQTAEKKISARAVVEVEYHTSIKNDPSLDLRKLPTTELTAYDKEIEAKANELYSGESTLETIVGLTNWINSYIEYDISYFGLNKPAKEVLIEQKGVCVEYTHLFISSAHSLGINTRYAAGYVKSEDWQAHAWTEVDIPGYGWLPVDATFGEIGILDNSHVLMFYGEDQNDIFDKITTTKTATFITEEKVTPVSVKNTTGLLVGVNIEYDEYIVDVNLENTRNEYVYFVYSLVAPEELGINERKVMLLSPKEKIEITYELDENYFREGVKYTIPVNIRINDAKNQLEFAVVKPKIKIEDIRTDEIEEVEKSCPLGLFLGVLGLFIFKVRE